MLKGLAKLYFITISNLLSIVKLEVLAEKALLHHSFVFQNMT